MKVRLPKIRELIEAVTAVFSPRYTTRFPAEPCIVPEAYRGKPEFDMDACIGCGACVNVCPTLALTMTDETDKEVPTRTITQQADACIFCGNCQDNCTTENGIKLTQQWDLANLDRASMRETFEFELQMCEKCGAVVGAKQHLVWLCDKLGPLAYTNPSLLLAKNDKLEMIDKANQNVQPDRDVQAGDYMRILCPECKCELNINL